MVYKEFVANVKEITQYYKILVEETKSKKIVGNTNEWLLDNYFIISEQEKTLREELRSKAIKTIKPKRKKQIDDLIYSFLKKLNFQIDINLVFNDINEYQKKQEDYFSYTEINYIYILFRVILIKEISNLSKELNIKLLEKQKTDLLIAQIAEELATQGTSPMLKKILQDKSIAINPHYLEPLSTILLNDIDNISEEFVSIFKEILIKYDTSLKESLQREIEISAFDNILISSLFISLKKMTKYEMSDLYTHISFTENVLMSEKADMYSHMYDNNKNNYRTKIIRDAKRHHMSEYQYTLGIVERANQTNRHVGWLLFKPKKYKERSYAYIIIVTFITIILSLLLSFHMGYLAFLLLLIPISQFVIEISNQLLFYLHKPNSTLKLKFEEGIPEEYATMVIIPTILKTKEKVDQIFNKLEVYYLSNYSDNLYFTLLGDCSSESTKYTDFDKEIISAGLEKVKELNEKYNKKQLFNFIYRNRFYSEGEASYLGFERKRGAILHFNDLILGNLTVEEKTRLFQCQTLDDFDKSITYIITLDTDTQLVLYTAFQLIGAIAHPMNQPVLAEDGKNVVSGYGIMQPRINVDVEVTNKSKYAQLFSGLGGLDVYTTASYELYQDTFNEGSFVGKGIYNLKIFQQVLKNTFPQNLILSHDLLEGNYIRCGLINDVILFDDSPSNYLDDAKRHHRWVRGDWQIVGWLKKKVKNEKGEKVKNPVTILGKWKIFDNLRRSVMSLALLLLLFYGFTIGKLNPLIYLLVVLIIVMTPIFFYLISRIVYKRKYSRYIRYYMTLIRGMGVLVLKSLIVLSILPKEAFMYLDAIVRALYRMLISKKNLLNWITSEDAEKMTKNTLKSFIKNFRINYIIAVLFVITTFYFKTDTYIYFVVASVVAFLWCIAPIWMFYLGKKIVTDEKRLNKKEIEEVKELAHRTWNYFYTFLTEETNYLIPDNYQENRNIKTDYRTSPTNIGFSMISVIAAHELEFIQLKETVSLLEKIIDNVIKLKKWEGHLYNWYDINTLEELHPFFVSTADSGNFVACLYIVKGFLKKIKENNVLNKVLRLIDNTNFTKLYNTDLDVFSIGYDDRNQHILPYHYNNFASEARLTSYVAISKRDVPYKHWFSLDKTLTKYKFFKGVASWYGSLFEYYMPLIFMKTFKHTLLDETYAFAYYTQKEFIKEIDKNLPWGISEAGYNALDDAQNYKYKAFGVPYLKFQNTISNRIVISPYSSMIAIGVKDKEVYENIQKFKQLGMYREFGLYESYDEEDKVSIKAYYAHHQGMILAALTNYLHTNCLQEYFHMDKAIQSMETLLKEKAQIKPYIDLKTSKFKRYKYPKESQENDIREYDDVSAIPEIGVLSNGYYTLLINDRGCGFSRYKDLYINRYRKITAENYGVFMYIRNVYTDELWSNTYAPLNVKPDKYRVIFASDRIKFMREDYGIVTTTEICVVKDENIEIRKIAFENLTSKDIVLELTSYGEVIMCQNDRDIAHRSFNSMTIFSEFDESTSTLIFSRKSRHIQDTKYYTASRMFFENENDLKVEYETSRLHFIERNNTTQNPSIINNKGNLTKGLGSSLDPIMSIRREIIVKAGKKENTYLLIGFAKSRQQIIDMFHNYKTATDINNAFDMATVLNNMRISYSHLKGEQMRIYNAILKHIFQTASINEKRKNILQKNTLSQPNLWRFGISGDLPIILVEMDTMGNALILKDIIQAYEFYKSMGLFMDIVVINNENQCKEKLLQKYISDLVDKIYYFNYFENTKGNVYTISSCDLSEEERTLLYTIARITIDSSTGKSLEKQIHEMQTEDFFSIDDSKYTTLLTKEPKQQKNLEFYNEYGGFVNNGSEYCITNINTPMPWINVIANPEFGFIVSSSMSGFTYAYNSQMFKITSWSNDMISDPASEIILINKQRFVPTIARHGLGYSVFTAESYGFDVEIKIFAALQSKIKYYLIDIKNTTIYNQTLQLDLITNIVLGATEEKTNRHLLSDWDENDNSLYFRNVYHQIFKHVTLFLTSTEKITNFDDKNPTHKSIEVQIDIEKESSKQMAFMIGVKEEDDNISKTIPRIIEESHKVIDYWKNKLSVIKITTPDTSFNYVMNNWYLYQTLVSRIYARTGFYQVGGAYGFRDQLQDMVSVMYNNPQIARNQIIKHASHQFPEGDVLHWWHEDNNFGTRTTFSDDYLWLIYVTYEYLKVVGDYSILDEEVAFIEGEKLPEGETERGIHFHKSDKTASLYNHLKLCIQKSLSQMGQHSLPLMGGGDWNDGMNKVGAKGKGESVWMGFFLLDLLNKMIPLASYKQDDKFVEECQQAIPALTTALNKNAWDGEWYLRAYFDNGDTLGSRNNTECQIDLLSQSWSILTEVADEQKKQSILRETENRLVDRQHKIIKLLTPSFKNSKNNPGYIMDYLEGIRENGGQYSHAAMWYIMALLKEGCIDKAYTYYAMINPINRTSSLSDVLKYKVEPYSMAADIYSNPQFPGRGGWTWYTGSSSWAYKVGLEHILGFKKEGDTLRIEPKIPSNWSSFTIEYRYIDTLYTINVKCEKDNKSEKNKQLILDGKPIREQSIKLINDKKQHIIEVKY